MAAAVSSQLDSIPSIIIFFIPVTHWIVVLLLFLVSSPNFTLYVLRKLDCSIFIFDFGLYDIQILYKLLN